MITDTMWPLVRRCFFARRGPGTSIAIRLGRVTHWLLGGAAGILAGIGATAIGAQGWKAWEYASMRSAHPELFDEGGYPFYSGIPEPQSAELIWIYTSFIGVALVIALFGRGLRYIFSDE